MVPGLLLDLGDDQFVEHVVRTSQPHGHNLTSHPLQMQMQTKIQNYTNELGLWVRRIVHKMHSLSKLQV